MFNIWIIRSYSGFIRYSAAVIPWKHFPIAVHVMNIHLSHCLANTIVSVLMDNLKKKTLSPFSSEEMPTSPQLTSTEATPLPPRLAESHTPFTAYA